MRPFGTALALQVFSCCLLAQEKADWPPPLKGARDGTVALQADEFLRVPEKVEKARKDARAAVFTVASAAPRVEFAYHRDLGEGAVSRRLWSRCLPDRSALTLFYPAPSRSARKITWANTPPLSPTGG